MRRHIDAQTWNHYGIMVYQRGYANYSVKYFSESTNQSPNFIDPWNNMGVALIALQNYTDALACFDKALDISKSNDISAILWNNKGITLYSQGELDDAGDCLNQSLEQNPNYSPAWNNLGVIMAAQNLHQQALQYYNKSISLDAYNKKAWNNKAVSLAELRCYEESRECLKNAVVLDENYALAWINAAVILRTIGETDNSQKALSNAKMHGYNGTKMHLTADIQAVMMKDNATDQPINSPFRAPAASGVLTAFSLLSVWAIFGLKEGKN